MTTDVPIWVEIATRTVVDETVRLVRTCLYDSHVEKVLLHDNGHDEDGKRRFAEAFGAVPRVEIIRTDGQNLHQMWNDGIRRAIDAGPVSLLIVNDDVRLPLCGIGELHRRLWSDDRIGIVYPMSESMGRLIEAGCEDGPLVDTGGRLQDEGGMTGHCFMLKALPGVPTVNEAYGYWYGDNDLVLKWANAGWLVCRAFGVPSKHVGGGNNTGIQFKKELTPIRKADRLLFIEEWGIEMLNAGSKKARWPDRVV